MGRSGKAFLVAAVSVGLLFVLGLPLSATLKYKKETGKKCAFCHSGIPKPGDEDPQLNAEGKRFKENDYELTDEQRKKPDPAHRR